MPWIGRNSMQHLQNPFHFVGLSLQVHTKHDVRGNRIRHFVHEVAALVLQCSFEKLDQYCARGCFPGFDSSWRKE